MKDRVITGYGVACHLGIGRDAFRAGLATAEAVSSRTLSPPTSFETGTHTNVRVAEVPDFDAAKILGEKGLRSLDRLTKLVVSVTRLALHDAGLKIDNQYVGITPEDVGFVCSNAYGSLEAISELHKVAELEDARYINPAKFPNTVSNTASGYASIWEDVRALNVSVSDGNCGALDAVAVSDIHLGHERAAAILTGGAEAMSEPLFLAFEKLGGLGDAVLAEAAALVTIENAGNAAARGKSGIGSILGYGTAFSAPLREHALLFASEEALADAIRIALDDAGLAAADVDLVVSGVSGLRPYDDAELGSIAQVFGTDTAVLAPKRLFGETLGAGGALGLLAAVEWLAGTPVAPAAVLAGTPPATRRHAVVTALGYYGNASAIVVAR